MKILSKTSITILLIYLLLSIYLSTVPLFNILGYEFSLTMSFVSYLVSGLYLILRFNEIGEGPYLKKELRLSVHCILFSLLPLIFMTIKGFFITNCNYWSGLGFYVLLPTVSAFFGSSIGFISSVFPRTMTKRVLLFIALSLLIFLKTPYQLIYGTNVDAFNHLFGYFAGHIYDEVVLITPAIIWYRLYTISTSLTVLILGSILLGYRKKPAEKHKKEIAILIPFLAIVACSNIFSSHLGFSRTEGTIRKVLKNKLEASRFTFYYAKDDGLLGEIVSEFEFRQAQIAKKLDLHGKGKIFIFIYPDADTQKRLMGSRGMFLAKPTNGQIYMTVRHPMYLPIKHELTHIMAAEFGIPILKISPRMGLVEGLATAMEGYEEGMTFHELAKAAYSLDLAPDIKRLMSLLGFFVEQSSRAYFVSASFVRYLIDSYGVEKFKEIYGGKSFQDAYGVPLEEISKRWKEKILKIQLGEDKLKNAEAIFKPKGIFDRKCAHEVASLVQRSKACLSGKKSHKAQDLMKKGFELSGEDPAMLLKLAETQFESGKLEEAYRSALDIFKEQESSEVEIPEYIQRKGLTLIADYHAIKGDSETALGIYEKIRNYLDSPDSYLENELRMTLVKGDLGKFADYIKEKDALKKVPILRQILLSHPESILNLMAGHLYFRKNDFKNSSHLLSKAFSLTEPLELYRSKLLAISLFYLKDIKGAKKIFARIKRDRKDDAVKLFADDWLEKIDFYRNRKQ